MKKTCCRAYPKLMLCLLTMMILFLGTSIPAMAADKYMEGRSADFQIELDESGGAQVTETWDCYFGGDTITRYRRNYLIPGGVGDIRIQEVLMDDVAMKVLDARDDSRPEGCAAIWQEDNKVIVEMYLSALDEAHTFTIRYYMTDAVILYDDVAEFHTNLTSTNEAFSVDTVTSHITIPYGTEDHGLYFWARGPVENASFTAVEDEGMVNEFDLYLEAVTPERPAQIRFAMPLELFPEGERFESGEALERILAEESTEEPSDDPVSDPSSEVLPEEEEVGGIRGFFLDLPWRFREIYYDIMRIWGVAALVAALAPLIITMLFSGLLGKIGQKTYLPKKYKELRKIPADAPEYYRSLPDDMKPALVYKLASIYPAEKDSAEAAKNGSPFAATIMDLVEKGMLSIEKDWKDNVYYKLTDKMETAELTEYESILLNIYKEAGADQHAMTTDEITTYMHTNYGWCKGEYHAFNDAVNKSFEDLKLTETHEALNLPRKLKIVLSAVLALFIFIGISNMSLFGTIPGLIMGLVFGFINVILIEMMYNKLRPSFTILNEEGEKRYTYWMAYSRFLKDFTLFEEREVPDIAVWRKYLVYATALGCSKNIMEELRVRFPEVYSALITDPYIGNYEEFVRSAEEIDHEGAYTIRSSSSDSSGSSDSGWGDVSDSGGSSDSDSGGGGSDFD